VTVARLPSLAAALVALAAIVGCGGQIAGETGVSGDGGAHGSCLITAVGPGLTTPASLCLDFVSGDAHVFISTCSSAAPVGGDGGIAEEAKYSPAPCSRVGVVSGCRLTEGTLVYDEWFASDFSAATAAMACASQGGTPLSL
jgi:hypothetical protein